MTCLDGIRPMTFSFFFGFVGLVFVRKNPWAHGTRLPNPTDRMSQEDRSKGLDQWVISPT